MKSKLETVKKAASAIMMLVLFLTFFVSATDDAYVTENDPLVSLSYIENVLTPSLKEYVDGRVSNVTADEIAAALVNDQNFKDYVAQIVQDELKNYSFPSSGGAAASSEFRTLNLAAGQKITALGKCELIMQSGACTVFGPSSSGAVKDLSADKTLRSGSALTVGNYVEISYSDGSGIAALRDGTTLLIRGEFSVAER